MFLLVSSHNAHDNMDFVPVVGKHPSYPDKQYCCFIAEVICCYIYSRYILRFLRVKIIIYILTKRYMQMLVSIKMVTALITALNN